MRLKCPGERAGKTACKEAIGLIKKALREKKMTTMQLANKAGYANDYVKIILEEDALVYVGDLAEMMYHLGYKVTFDKVKVTKA